MRVDERATGFATTTRRLRGSGGMPAWMLAGGGVGLLLVGAAQLSSVRNS